MVALRGSSVRRPRSAPPRATATAGRSIFPHTEIADTSKFQFQFYKGGCAGASRRGFLLAMWRLLRVRALYQGVLPRAAAPSRCLAQFGLRGCVQQRLQVSARGPCRTQRRCMMQSDREFVRARAQRNKSFILYAGSAAVLCVAFSYAAVPLYRMFCQACRAALVRAPRPPRQTLGVRRCRGLRAPPGWRRTQRRLRR